MDENSNQNGFFSEIIFTIIEHHSTYELLALYTSIALGYWLTSIKNNGSFVSFAGSLYKSRSNSTIGLKIGMPLLIFVTFIIHGLISTIVGGAISYCFLKATEFMPSFHLEFSFSKITIECALLFQFSSLFSMIGVLASNEKQ